MSNIRKIYKAWGGEKLIDIKESIIQEILISFGGGAGGARSSIYIKDMKELEDGFLEVTDFTGVVQRVNKRFIVYIAPRKLIKAHFKQLGLDKDIRKYVEEGSRENIKYFVMDTLSDYEYVDNYTGDKDLTPIYTEELKCKR